MYLDFVVKLLKKEKKKLRDEIQKLETKKTQSKKFKLVSNEKHKTQPSTTP